MLRIYAMQKESEATSMIAPRWSADHRERLSYKICTTAMRATGVSRSPLPGSDRWFETMTSYKHSSPSPFAGPAQAKRSRCTSGIGSSSLGPSPVLNGDPQKPEHSAASQTFRAKLSSRTLIAHEKRGSRGCTPPDQKKVPMVSNVTLGSVACCIAGQTEHQTLRAATLLSNSAQRPQAAAVRRWGVCAARRARR
jgi:hypothetical protein